MHRQLESFQGSSFYLLYLLTHSAKYCVLLLHVYKNHNRAV